MTTRDDIVQHIAHSLGIQVDPQAKARALLDEACPLPSPDDDHRCGWRDGFTSCGNLLEKSKSRIAELEAELGQFELLEDSGFENVYRKVPREPRPAFNDFTFTVKWSDEDEAYIGRVLERSLLAAHGDTPPEALKEIRDVLKACLDDEESERKTPAEVKAEERAEIMRRLAYAVSDTDHHYDPHDVERLRDAAKDVLEFDE